jgi:hypothetical protein
MEIEQITRGFSGRREDVKKPAIPALTIRGRNGNELLAQSELVYDVFVAIGVVGLKIVQQTTPFADQHEKTAARTVIFLVCLEMLRQRTNALA